MEIETGIANAVLEKMDSLGAVFLPPWLVKDTFVWFALDNIKFLESTPFGMNTLHGTALAVYQSAAPDKLPMISPIYIDRSGRFAGRTKDWCFKLCMACDDDIHNALESLGHRDLSEEEYDQLERFVRQLYKSKVYTQVNEFRWFLYCNRASKGGETSTNNWLTNTAYSTSTLRANDLEKGWWKPSTPPVSGRLWLGVWHDQTSLCSSKMFESSSPCSCDELSKVWMQTWMQEDM